MVNCKLNILSALESDSKLQRVKQFRMMTKQDTVDEPIDQKRNDYKDRGKTLHKEGGK